MGTCVTRDNDNYFQSLEKEEMRAALLKRYLSLRRQEGSGTKQPTPQPQTTSGRPMDMVTYVLPLVPPTDKDVGPCRQTQTDDDEVVIIPTVTKVAQESSSSQPFEAEVFFVEPQPAQSSSSSIQEDAAFVFLRSRSHYLRNPAPKLNPEALDLNFQGRFTIEQEAELRASLP